MHYDFVLLKNLAKFQVSVEMLINLVVEVLVVVKVLVVLYFIGIKNNNSFYFPVISEVVYLIMVTVYFFY